MKTTAIVILTSSIKVIDFVVLAAVKLWSEQALAAQQQHIT